MRQERPFDCIVLAGSRGASDPVAAPSGASCKALVAIAGKPMLTHVLDALEASGWVDRITVAIDPAIPLAEEAPALAQRLNTDRYATLAPSESPCATLGEAFAERRASRPLLVVTGDHPLLTGEMLAAFCAGARASNRDVAAAVAPTHLMDRDFPGVRRTALRFRDASYSGCNLFALMGSRAANVLSFWATMEGERKRPLRMARRIGFGTLVAYAFGRLTLDDAVDRLARCVATELAAVRLNWSEAARDVDTPEDLALVERILDDRRTP